MAEKPKYRITLTRIVGKDGRARVQKGTAGMTVLYILNPKQKEHDYKEIAEKLEEYDLKEEVMGDIPKNFVKMTSISGDDWGVQEVDSNNRIYVSKWEAGNYVLITVYPEYSVEELESKMEERIP